MQNETQNKIKDDIFNTSLAKKMPEDQGRDYYATVQYEEDERETKFKYHLGVDMLPDPYERVGQKVKNAAVQYAEDEGDAYNYTKGLENEPEYTKYHYAVVSCSLPCRSPRGGGSEPEQGPPEASSSSPSCIGWSCSPSTTWIVRRAGRW
jgi:hypothetical protein